MREWSKERLKALGQTKLCCPVMFVGLQRNSFWKALLDAAVIPNH